MSLEEVFVCTFWDPFFYVPVLQDYRHKQGCLARRRVNCGRKCRWFIYTSLPKSELLASLRESTRQRARSGGGERCAIRLQWGLLRHKVCLLPLNYQTLAAMSACIVSHGFPKAELKRASPLIRGKMAKSVSMCASSHVPNPSVLITWKRDEGCIRLKRTSVLFARVWLSVWVHFL